jgi:hypothetical protein
MAKKLKIYNGSSWEDVTFAITPPTTSVTNSFSTNQVIDASTSVAALRITQRGAGEAFRVEDESNPDSSPFVIDAAGNVGIGTVTPQQKFSVTGNIHMNGGTGTGISWASDQSSHYLKFDSGLNGIKLQGYSNIVFETLGQNERMRIASDGLVTFDGSGLISRIGGVNKLEVGSGAVKIWAGRGGIEGGEMYLASTPATNSYGNTNDAVFDVYDGIVRMSPDGFSKIYMLRPANDVGTSIGLRNITASTSAPSGGQNGDIWAVYTA